MPLSENHKWNSRRTLAEVPLSREPAFSSGSTVAEAKSAIVARTTWAVSRGDGSTKVPDSGTFCIPVDSVVAAAAAAVELPGLLYWPPAGEDLYPSFERWSQRPLLLPVFCHYKVSFRLLQLRMNHLEFSPV